MPYDGVIHKPLQNGIRPTKFISNKCDHLSESKPDFPGNVCTDDNDNNSYIALIFLQINVNIFTYDIYVKE